MADWSVIQGNCADVMAEMPEKSVDLTVTSPPYDNLRTYHGYSFDFERVARQLYRVTKDGGVVVWVVGDAVIDGSETGTSFRQALGFMDAGFRLCDTMIYSKNAIPQNNRRYEQHFEYMFVFTKNGMPKTFNPIMVPCTCAGESSASKTYRNPDGTLKPVWDGATTVKEKKVKGNIWHYNAGYNLSTQDDFAFEHPAMFPEALARDHIVSWTDKGDVVLDPFCGSGTTGKMAHLLEREFIGIEIDPEFCELSRRRIATYSKEGYQPDPVEQLEMRATEEHAQIPLPFAI